MTSLITASHARDLVARITRDDDGAHAAELLELIEGVSEPDNQAGAAAKDYLKSLQSGECECATRVS